jgi:hypothetical protein
MPSAAVLTTTMIAAAMIPTTPTEAGQRMLVLRPMRRLADMPAPIPSLIALEVVERLCPTPRQRPMISMMRVIAVIDMAVEAARPMEPGPRSKKHAAYEPVRPVIPIGRAVIWSVVKVPVRANRRLPN